MFLLKILKNQLDILKNQLKENGYDIEFTDFVVSDLAKKGYDKFFGARPLKRLIQKEIVDLLSRKIIEGSLEKDKKTIVDIFEEQIVLR